jgi:site-specific recombinase XerC
VHRGRVRKVRALAGAGGSGRWGRPSSWSIDGTGASPSLAALRIAAVSDREVSRALALSRMGLAEASLRRFRDSLSSFFAWAVRERMILTKPVTPTRVPKSSTPRTAMYPFSKEEQEELYSRAAKRDQTVAEIAGRRLDRPR